MSSSITSAYPAIQAAINQGRGTAAAITGQPYTQFRPSSAFNPLASGNEVGTIMVLMDAAFPPRFVRPALYGKPVHQAILDPTNTAVGDYLVDADGVAYFIVSQEPLLPIAAVRCTHVLDVRRPTGATGPGAQPYGGDIASMETPIMTGWPASVLTKSRGEMGATGLPGDVKFPWSEVLMPIMPGVVIEFADVLVDENGLRYIVSSTEMTELGYRMLAEQQTA